MKFENIKRVQLKKSQLRYLRENFDLVNAVLKDFFLLIKQKHKFS